MLQGTANMGVLLQHESSYFQDVAALLPLGASAAGVLGNSTDFFFFPLLSPLLKLCSNLGTSFYLSDAGCCRDCWLLLLLCRIAWFTFVFLWLSSTCDLHISAVANLSTLALLSVLESFCSCFTMETWILT